jgi:flagellar basal body-associated protein FliL
MALAFLTLLTGLAISAVAIYYSVIGLAAIFSAAVIPIVVMGAILEVSKLVAAWWLKANWYRAPILLKSYMLVAVIVLMLITSMGIFGFLSKAHTDQAIVTGDVQAQVYLIDEQIKVERENIANAQSLIKQLDDAVVGINASGVDREIKLRDGTTRTQSAAERALQVRRSQANDRANLTKQIEEAQKKILSLQEKKAPIAANMREVEAKVGPIKYIAQLIYGDNPDENLLEKAVTWVIITIVFVFDPLAVLLLLASQMSFQWARQEKEERKDELVQETTPPEGTGEETSTAPQPAVGEANEGSRRESQQDSESSTRDDVAEEANRKIAEIENEVLEPVIPDDSQTREKDPLAEWNEMIAEAEKAAEEEKESEEQEIFDSARSEEKAAMHKWKSENPEGSLKLQRQLLSKGKIDKLPWDDYLQAKPDFEENEAAEEAAKWALEQLEQSKKKDSDMDGESTRQTSEEKQGNLTGYVQNAEQSPETLWQKVQKAKER